MRSRRSESLLGLVGALSNWAQTHMSDVEKARLEYDARV
jgi:hypothetical protein